MKLYFERGECKDVVQRAELARIFNCCVPAPRPRRGPRRHARANDLYVSCDSSFLRSVFAPALLETYNIFLQSSLMPSPARAAA